MAVVDMNKGKHPILDEGPTPDKGRCSTGRQPTIGQQRSKFINIHKRAREIEVSAVVQLENGTIALKKSKVVLFDDIFFVSTMLTAEFADRQPRR